MKTLFFGFLDSLFYELYLCPSLRWALLCWCSHCSSLDLHSRLESHIDDILYAFCDFRHGFGHWCLIIEGFIDYYIESRGDGFWCQVLGFIRYWWFVFTNFLCEWKKKKEDSDTTTQRVENMLSKPKEKYVLPYICSTCPLSSRWCQIFS